MTIEIDELVAKSLQKLKDQADQLHLPLHQYLELLAETAAPAHCLDDSEEEF